MRRLLLALLLVPGTAGAAEDMEFSGALLVGLAAPPEVVALDAVPGGWSFSGLFDGRDPRRDPSLRADEATDPGLYWIKARSRVVADEAADGTEERHPWDQAHDAVEGTVPGVYGRLLSDLDAIVHSQRIR